MAGLDEEITVDPECAANISLLERGEYAFLILRIEKPLGDTEERVITKEKVTVDECQMEVRDSGISLERDETAGWYCFRKHLEEYDIAYGASHVEYKTDDGRPTTKLIYVLWNSDKAKTRDRMKYSKITTKVLDKFHSPLVEHQASDADDITYYEIVDGKLGRK